MIRLENITKVFNPGMANEITALQNVSLELKKGTFTVIVGANGSGKSTLLNIISGTESATSGTIFLEQHNVTKLPEHKRSKWIARVFQNPLYGVASGLTILENFRLAALRTSSKNLKTGINSSFQLMIKEKIAVLGMGLENKIHQPMGTLSGGQRQALTLLMCVMAPPDVLLLDEPTAALDPKSAAIVLALADQLIQDYNLTALMITHSLKDAHQYGNRIIQMAEGKVVRDMKEEEKNQLQATDIYKWFE